TQLRAALRVYTSSWRYLHGVKNVAYRVDLDGNQDEPIDAQHVEFAAQKLKEGKARVNAARKAQLAKQKANKEASPTANQSKKSVTTPPSLTTEQKRKPSAARRKKVKNITDLPLGQQIKVKIGKSVTPVTITELSKDTI